MSYRVKLSPKANKFLNKCEKDLSERIKKKLRLLKEDPFHYLEHYEGQDYYKLRVGDYRALVDVDQSRNKVFVRIIDHRSKIYKNK
jgi:mRNA interferase RelE/StbE